MRILGLLLTGALALFARTSVFSQEIPRLVRNGEKTELLVDGKPFTLLAGELHNSTSGSVGNMESTDVWKRMADKNLNSVIAAASWELVEPEEGKFNFREVDAMIDGAREAGLRLVILWFGSWKNGQSTYVPAWVKNDPKRFPLALYSDRETAPILSALGKNSMQADAKAFAALMAHIREYDKARTVVMVQVENEIGTLDQMSSFMGTPNRGMRDYSSIADKAFQGKVPQALMSWLQAHKGQLHPAVEAAWARGGYRSSGTWTEVFGEGTLTLGEGWKETYPYITEELFNCWNYATYVETIAAAGKREYPLPMFVNAWVKQERGGQPGYYPSGGAQPHVFDIWKAGAPSIDFYATDIYAIPDYDWYCTTFSQGGNPLVIPETRSSADGASRAIYTFGKYAPLVYSPFGIDGGGLNLSADPNDHTYDKVYRLLGHFMDRIRAHTPGEDMQGLLLDPESGHSGGDSATLGKYTFSLSSLNMRGFAAVTGVESDYKGNNASEVTGVLIMQEGPDEFLIIGGAGAARLSAGLASREKNRHCGILSVDEIRLNPDGSVYTHRLNGDETSMGVCIFREGAPAAYRVKLYEY